ncbi:MAG: hypothetical protein Q8R07_04845 [Candidatus Uhrbacteria bacterium]|nr:hypothetical protein [Candidatus Uhrbacteria bacterium]
MTMEMKTGTVLVKFYFSDADVARGFADRIGLTADMMRVRPIKGENDAAPIERVRRTVDVERGLEAKHEHFMAQDGLLPVREGRADSGHAVFGKPGLANVVSWLVLDDLLAVGFKAVAVKKIQKPKWRGGMIVPNKFTHIVEIELTTDPGEDEVPEVRAILDLMRAYLAEDGGRVIAVGHVWTNSNKVDTVNLTGGFQPQRPRRTNVLRFSSERGFYAEPVETANKGSVA